MVAASPSPQPAARMIVATSWVSFGAAMVGMVSARPAARMSAPEPASLRICEVIVGSVTS